MDLFSENRAEFLVSTVTDAEGDYAFDLAAPMCGVVTFIAPSGETFISTAGRFRNRQFCAAGGQDVSGLDATILSAAHQAMLGGRVSGPDGSGVNGVEIVLYQASPDGSRGQWLRSTATDPTGDFSLWVASGCFVLDLVAPADRTWGETGRQYRQLSACVEANQVEASLNGVLN